MNRVYVGGTFDLFHAGHVELLRRAAEHGGVVVSLNTDRYVEKFKRRPIMNYLEREAVVRACRYVKLVVANNGNERGLILALRPTHIVYAINGDEYDRESYLKRLGIDEVFLYRYEIELLLLPYTPSPSSSEVIERVIQRSGGEPREPHRASEDARQLDVPDEEAGRDACLCLGPGTSYPCRAR